MNQSFSPSNTGDEEAIIAPATNNAIETTIQKFKELERVPLDKGPLSPLPSPRPRAKSITAPSEFKDEIVFQYIFIL
jgi:hypothetical protein